MSVGGASRTLAKLRELLDDDLFLRTNRGLVPTPRARELNGGVSELLVNYGRLFENHPLVKLAQERTLTRKDFKAYRQIRVVTGPLNDLDDPWFDAEADIPLMAENIAVWSPFFIPIAQILCQTNLWGALPLQLAVQLQKLMPDLIILGRPKNAVVYGPTLIWHNRTHQDPASVWVRSVIVSAPKTLADVNSIHFIED